MVNTPLACLNKYVKRASGQQGFTLIELIIVIVLLAILSVGVSSFLKLGSGMFVDVKNRSEIVATARFAIERLKRELRLALPNSVVALPSTGFNASGIQCLQYTPIITSAHYLEIPTINANEVETNTISVVDFKLNGIEFNGENDVRVAVYPIEHLEVYDNELTANKVNVLVDATLDDSGVTATNRRWDINFTNNIVFETDSPTQRLYFIADNKVSYCVRGRELKRFVGANPNDNDAPITFFNSYGVLMATDLLFDTNIGTYPFRVFEDTQLRNSMIFIHLVFEKNQEVINFTNEVHISNAP